jgi:hypothetical protein
MYPLKKILILCDAHDCIRHEGNNSQLLKQLYVIVYLFKSHAMTADYTLHVNNRAIIGFEGFWKKESSFYHFLDDYMISKPWSDIDMLAYDLIICHPDYQIDLQQHFLKTYGIEHSSTIFSLLELQYTCDMHYDSAGKLFIKGGALEINRNPENQAALSIVKQALDQSAGHFTINMQEAAIPDLDLLLKRFNERIQVDQVNQLLILDDYKRGYFVGDSVYWMEKLKKLIDIFPENCNICINITNKIAFDYISGIFQQSLSENITFTNHSWADIKLEVYDLVLCHNDILLKFFWHIHVYVKSVIQKIVFYSFTAMDERPIKQHATLDFYSNIFHSRYQYKLDQANTKKTEKVFKEISLLPEEHNWAGNWFRTNGVTSSDKLIIVLHGASSAEKVIYDAELLKLIKRLCDSGNKIKVVLVTEKKIEDMLWLNGTVTAEVFKNVIVADALGLRTVMSLLANKQVVAIIGPCTGLMHLADGIYTYMLRHQLIAETECPLLLTYAGKQAQERNYHPHGWWKNTNLTNCCIAVSRDGDSNNKQLISLSECPTDQESFNKIGISAREINCEMIIKFLRDQFPGFTRALVNLHLNNNQGLLSSMSHLQEGPAIKRIPTFLINLKSREERRNHILKQFSGKTVFDCTLVEAIEGESGRIGLWQTIRKIVSDSIHAQHDYILICEDDHEFTDHYAEEKLFSCIYHANLLKADVLLGGICFCDNNIRKVHDNLISADNFACMQFTLIFRSFFETILNAQFTREDCADFKITELSDKKLVIYPFISRQKDFGYSDVSDGYYENKMNEFFNETSRRIQATI